MLNSSLATVEAEIHDYITILAAVAVTMSIRNHNRPDEIELRLKIEDASSGMPIIGATITDMNDNRTVITDRSGVGKLTLLNTPRWHRLQIVATGYESTPMDMETPRRDPNITVFLSHIVGIANSAAPPYIQVVTIAPRDGDTATDWYELSSPPIKVRTHH